jgi:class 3 adenylate cyclase/tetratricopeptide (TPR) repeat protein
VLFADLKGSMELLADRDPEEARRLLDPVLEHMMEAVHRYEGTVNQVMGDGIMALFGAPLAQEDHAVRASYAALRMQEDVRRYAAGIFHSHGVSLQIRVGLNSGEVVVRAIGSDLHMDYTAVGQTTHLAARMEQLAEPGTTLLAPGTLALAEGFVQVISRGPVPVKGLADPVQVFALTGASPVRSRLHAAATHGLTRFVGRDAELDVLRRALTLAGRGRGQIVAIVGEPGVGKSRLVWEFTHSHRSAGWLVLEAASVSYGKATAYLPVIELLRVYFQIEAGDEVRRIREKVTGKLVSLDRALEATLPVFFSLLDVGGDDPEWMQLDPSQRRRLTLDALKRLLLRESQVQPLLLVVEDLHWIDTETQALLDLLVESLPTAPVLLLVNYRPEYTHAWGSKTSYQQVRLDALPPASAAELLDALLGTDAALGDLKDQLVERTQGNPFFLEESVRALVETKTLGGSRGAYVVAGPMPAPQLPATAQAILAARIDRLAPDDKRLLQAAAVIGKGVAYAQLQAIAEMPEEDLRACLARLQAAEFLYETHLFPDLEYTFKHALTHEVAYTSVLHERRRALHARIVAAIETLASDRLAEQAERLAHHALRGELWEKAVAYLRQAGLRAMARAAYRDAIAHLEQALAAVRHLPETRNTTELTIDILIDIRGALLPFAEFARMEGYLHEAEALARTLGDQHRFGRIATFMVVQRVSIGAYDEAVRYGQEALTVGRTLADRSIQVVAATHLGVTHAARGEFNDAVSVLEQNAALGDDLRHERFGTPNIPLAVSGVFLADVLSQLGRFDEAIGHAETAVQAAQAADHPYTLCFGLMALGLVHFRRGDLPRATRILEQSLDLGRTWQIVLSIPLVTATLGAAYALAGRADEALLLVVDAVGEFQRRPIHGWPARILLSASRTYLSAGRIDEAASHAREALALTRRLGARGSEAHALCLAGDAASAAGAEDAPGYYREALTLAAELGMRPLVAHCHLGLGKLYRRTGQREHAREHLTIATTMYREMDMQFWLEQAEAEMKKLA